MCTRSIWLRVFLSLNNMLQKEDWFSCDAKAVFRSLSLGLDSFSDGTYFLFFQMSLPSQQLRFAFLTEMVSSKARFLQIQPHLMTQTCVSARCSSGSKFAPCSPWKSWLVGSQLLECEFDAKHYNIHKQRDNKWGNKWEQIPKISSFYHFDESDSKVLRK